jgi:uncharacterized cupredoxin-like copper-binding protein
VDKANALRTAPGTGGVLSDRAHGTRRAAATRTRSVLVAGCLVAGLILASSSPAAAADKKAFCATNVKMNLALVQLFASGNGQSPSAAQVQQAQGPILALVDQAVTTAPADIVDQVKIVANALHANFQAGLNDPAVSTASSKIDDYAVKNCGYPVLNVTAAEYKFKGVPKTLKTGVVLVNFKNAGSESHEINIQRFKTSDTLKTLLALPKGQAKTRLEPQGNTGADPGQTSVGYFQFTKPGRYVAVCLIPRGTTSGSQTGTGPPHATLGMHAEFTVTK